MRILTQKTSPALYLTTYFLCPLLLIVGSISTAQAQNITFRSHLPYPSNGTSNIWGYVDGGGNEYALVGIYEGLSIVDVSNPDLPEELFFVPTQASNWHEIKTWNQHAYVSNEEGGGVLIVDLGSLPDTVTYSYFTDPTNLDIQTVHALWIDEQGYMYLFGSNSGGGANIYDLNPDPENPSYVASYNPTGNFTTDYIHDGFVRGDTLWASHVYIGVLEVVDMSDKQNPVTLTTFSTPNFFTHNSWPTSDNHYLFTTDEVDNSYLTSYDVSDLNNVTLLDKAQCNPGGNAIVHNVHLYNDLFAVTSYYTEGAVIWDITYPDNIIKVGQYDESPLTGGGYHGNWGVYPYLPSGTLLVSDIEEGLFVLTPDYVHAAWLYGVVTDSVSGALVNNAEVKVTGTDNIAFTSLSGEYKTGNGAAGLYDIEFSKPGYFTKVLTGVLLESGIYDTLNVALVPLPSFAYGGQVIDSVSLQAVSFAEVQIANDLFTFTVTTDADGYFNFPVFYEGTYEIVAGDWGYGTRYYDSYSINSSNSPITVPLSKKYYDDFSLNYGWTENGDALYGKWVRAEPQGTEFYSSFANPESDVISDYSDQCFVTGNFGTQFYDDPVFFGFTELRSPSFDISQYNDPWIKYYTWFFNATGYGFSNELLVYIVSGQDSVLIQTLKSNNTPMSIWKHQKIRVKNYLEPTADMSIHFYAENPVGNYSLFECGVDKFEIVDSVSVGIDDHVEQLFLLQPFPNPFTDQASVYYELYQENASGYEMVLLNIQGIMIASEKLSADRGTVSFDSESLPAGIYLVQLRNKNGVVKTVKVVKE